MNLEERRHAPRGGASASGPRRTSLPARPALPLQAAQQPPFKLLPQASLFVGAVASSVRGTLDSATAASDVQSLYHSATAATEANFARGWTGCDLTLHPAAPRHPRAAS